MKFKSAPLLLLSALLLLSGCETVSNTFDDVSWPKMPKIDWPSADKKEPAASPARAAQDSACPSVIIMPELSLMTQFTGGNIQNAAHEQVRTRFDRASATCRTSASVVEVVLNLNFTSALGPAGVKDAKVQANYVAPYFVSVVDQAGQIISKDVFALSLVFPKGQTNIMATETLRQTIPLSTATNPNNYRIMIGFQLSGNDLLYNRQMDLPPVSVETQNLTPPAKPTPAVADVISPPVSSAKAKGRMNE
jgi:hypothetical protein